jgi:hypothetical protein
VFCTQNGNSPAGHELVEQSLFISQDFAAFLQLHAGANDSATDATTHTATEASARVLRTRRSAATSHERLRRRPTSKPARMPTSGKMPVALPVAQPLDVVVALVNGVIAAVD